MNTEEKLNDLDTRVSALEARLPPSDGTHSPMHVPDDERTAPARIVPSEDFIKVFGSNTLPNGRPKFTIRDKAYDKWLEHLNKFGGFVLAPLTETQVSRLELLATYVVKGYPMGMPDFIIYEGETTLYWPDNPALNSQPFVELLTLESVTNKHPSFTRERLQN